MDTANKSIKLWLWAGLIMIAVQVLLGGITRLTGSGLSITEWKPILGALYPSNDAQWQAAFNEYKKIAQFKYLNNDYTLAQFKFIYFWEWLHRNWARVIALVFFVPFVWFLIKGYINKSNVGKYALLFGVGALQGLVGWIMVKSGINDTNLYVDHFKLAIHFITALTAFVLVWWYLQPFFSNKHNNKRFQSGATIVSVIIVLLCVQLAYGAFMAGLKAAAAAPSWPTINGAWIPAGIENTSLISNVIGVQFVHRTLAYIILLLVVAATVKLYKAGLRGFSLYWPLMAVCAQVLLGIASVLYALQALRNSMGIFEWFALMHQLVALVLLMSLVRWVYLIKAGKSTLAI